MTDMERLERAAKNYRQLAGFATDAHMHDCLIELAEECEKECGCSACLSADVLPLTEPLMIGRPALEFRA